MTNDELNEVLRLVNAARKSIRLSALERLPKGERRDNCQCPIARALCPDGVFISVGRTEAAFDEFSTHLAEAIAGVWGTLQPKPNKVILPTIIAEFTAAFDTGALPEFEDA